MTNGTVHNSHFKAVTEAMIGLDAYRLEEIFQFVATCTGTLWLAGNGGSFANAMHWECDLNRTGKVRACALGSNQARMTCIANDFSYDDIFVEPLSRLARIGDRILCFSCSGRSPNILRVLERAGQMNMPKALLTGPDIPSVGAHPILSVPDKDYGVIEDVHMSIGHWITARLLDGQ